MSSVAKATPQFFVPSLKKKDWKETLIDRIGKGKALPIVGASLCDDLLFGSHDALVEGWAEFINYPLSGRRLLPRMTQFQHIRHKADNSDNRRIKEEFDDYVKNILEQSAAPQLVEDLRNDVNYPYINLSQRAQRLHRPSFDDGLENPLLLLASLPLPIYVTTSYYDTLEDALQLAGKTPHSELCYWDQRLRGIPSVFENGKYKPTIDEPLVFHLHGRDAYLDSLVLTEDDHLDFLVAIAESRTVPLTNSNSEMTNNEGMVKHRNESAVAIPPPVRQAFADSSVLLLGYNVFDWDFRTLYRGVIRPSVTINTPKGVALQLNADERQRAFVNDYLVHEANWHVEWKSSVEYMQEIYHGWSSR